MKKWRRVEIGEPNLMQDSMLTTQISHMTANRERTLKELTAKDLYQTSSLEGRTNGICSSPTQIPWITKWRSQQTFEVVPCSMLYDEANWCERKLCQIEDLSFLIMWCNKGLVILLANSNQYLGRLEENILRKILPSIKNNHNQEIN